MRDILRRRERARRLPIHALAATQARAAYAAGSGVLEIPRPLLVRVDDLCILVRDGQSIAARLYAPLAEVLPMLVYFHGGGFTLGSIATHDVLCRQLSHLAGCAVVSVDYRLAPEYKFPTAAHDAWDALQWLVIQAGELGLDGDRVAVGGDSAGGTLAAVCALFARDAGLHLALQLLFYPGFAAQQDSRSHRLFAQGFVLEQAHIDWLFQQYLRSPADREDWRFAPLCAE